MQSVWLSKNDYEKRALTVCILRSHSTLMHTSV
jgi:hypothetical protein